MKIETIRRAFTPSFCLRTERLRLRPLCIADAADMYAYASMPEVTRYLPWNIHPDHKYTQRYLSYASGCYRRGAFYDMAIEHVETGHMIGTCGFMRFDPRQDSGEVGYVVDPRYWGKGIASEALRAILEYGFFQLGLYRIEGRYMVENIASRRVMEHCGMIFEGVLRGALLRDDKYEDIGVCAVLRSDWTSAKP